MSKGVFCYRNLSKPGVMWSIRSNLTGRVLARSEFVVIRNAELKVSQAGRNRVLKDKRKNVHAGIKGTWVREGLYRSIEESKALGIWYVKISYNPYKNDSFVRSDNGKPIRSACLVVLSSDGAWALGVE